VGYALCTAEKPSVAKDIARVIGATTRKDGYFEGNGYLVTWAVGHLIGLAEPHEYGFVSQKEVYGEQKEKAYTELPLIPEDFKLVILPTTKDQFKIMSDLIHRPDVDYIIDCGDMGAEGHILQWFIREKAGCTKPVKRFCATSMTDEAIKSAMGNLRDSKEFDNIIKGEFCKKKADWILGMSLSRTESIKYHTGINVGRVQSPTLYFIVKRYLEASNFKVTNYFGFDVEFAEGFHCFWNKDADDIFFPNIKDSEGRVLDKTAAKIKSDEIEAEGTGIITALETQKKGKDRPQLYDITELQRDANKKYGYTAAVTLATAQALYETQKVLSYPRTDSRYITSDLQPYMIDRVKAIGTHEKFKAKVQKLLSTGLNIDKKIVDDKKVTDHHALIPTEKIENFNMDHLIPTSEEKKRGVTHESMRNVLDLVLCRMVVAFSKIYIYEQTTVNVTFSNGLIFSATGKKPVSLGWKSVQDLLNGKKEELEDNQESGQIFPDISNGQRLNVKTCSVVDKKTTPPKLHTEASLLTAMENAGSTIKNGEILKGKGIGTQATRAEIIKKLFDVGYVETEQKGKTNYIKPTSKGLSIIRVLPHELYSPKITADWENEIAKIGNGDSTEENFMKNFIAFIHEKVREVKETDTGITFKKEREVFGVCPWCGNEVYRYPRKDETGKLISNNYYCGNKCGFRLDSADQTIMIYTSKKLTDMQAQKFISQSMILLKCQKKDATGTYKGEFTFKARESKGKTYCNVACTPVFKKRRRRKV